MIIGRRRPYYTRCLRPHSIDTEPVAASPDSESRDFLAIFVNGQPHRVDGSQAGDTLADFLRHRLRLTGTKICCAEGDCGSCTVLVGRRTPEGFTYEPTNACILFLHQVDGCHVVTIEGLGNERELSALQQALVEHHGIQCGFCTPGVVMALSGGYDPQADSASIEASLAGNLCRCTGYMQILEAVRTVGPQPAPMEEQYPAALLAATLDPLGRQPVVASDGKGGTISAPIDLSEALEFLEHHPEATIVAGATDLAVAVNRGASLPQTILSLERIDGLRKVVQEPGQAIIGAGCTWSAIADSLADELPQLSELLETFGSPQIRNRATIGGNLANASPVADSLPLLYVLGAEVEIISAQSVRRTPIDKFYRGYKDIDLNPWEIIHRIFLPLPEAASDLKLYKVSKRTYMDTATLTAAFLLKRNGGQVDNAHLAVGGAGPTVMRLPRTESFLKGSPTNANIFAAAGERAASEVSPQDDMRGSAHYRRLLLKNLLVRFHIDCGLPS